MAFFIEKIMAENKKAFVLYADILSTFDYLTMDQRGQVITWVLQYVNDMNPEPLPGLLAAICEPIKQQLKRDLVKYETRAANSRKNGQKGGAPTKPKKPSRLITNPGEPKKPDTVTVTDKVTVKDNVIDNEIYIKRIELEKLLSSSFSWQESVIKNMKAIKLNTNPAKVQFSIGLFLNKLEAEEDVFKTPREVKSHFSRWYKIQLEIENKTTTTKKQTRNESNAEHNAKTAEELGFNQQPGS